MQSHSNNHHGEGKFIKYKAWMVFLTIFLVIGLLLQTGLPLISGVQVAQAAGPGGQSGAISHTTQADFTPGCVTQSGTTVTNYNTNGEVRMLASLEDHFNGTTLDTSIWTGNWIYDWYQVQPTVSGGLLRLDGSYIQSLTSFNQSGRFTEARILVRASANNSANTDFGYYRNEPPFPPSPAPPVTADTGVRLFLTENGVPNNLWVRLVDGLEAIVDDDTFPNPDLTAWHIYRIEWGAVNTSFMIDGVTVSTLPESISGGDVLNARILLYHLDPSVPQNTAPMDVDWVRGGQYPAAGVYTSCVFDAGGVVNFSNANWSALVPSGSGLTIQTQTSLDNTTWSGWSTPISAATGSTSDLTSPSGRYFQYRLNFTSNLIQSAELQQIQVNYYGPTRLDVTPTSATISPGASQDFNAVAYDANDDPVNGVTINWSSSVGSIDANGLLSIPSPQAAGTFATGVTASLNVTGSSALTDTASITVPDLPPTASHGGPYTGSEGTAVALSGSGSDPNGGAVTYDWDLNNDGTYETPGQSLNYTWVDNNTYTIRFRVTSSTMQTTVVTTTATISNVAPTATFNAPTSVNEGDTVTLSLTSPSDPSTDDTTAGFTYAFDCGSGYNSFSSTTTRNCPTTDNGTLAVAGRIRDKDGGISTYTANVTVQNVAPTATFNAPTTVTEGSAVALSLTSPIDPSSADTTAGFTYDFDCGSGFDGYSSSSTINCPTADDGTLTVGGRIRDKNGGVSEYTDTVSVTNVAPTANSFVVSPAVVNEGQSISLELTAPFNDPSTTDTSAGFRFAFDCGSGTFGPISSTSSRVCPMTDAGNLTVRGRIYDKEDAFTEYSGSATVNNVPPSITSVTNDGPVFANQPVQITVSVNAYAGDTLTYEFDCDNNGIFELGPQTSNIGTCTFSTKGSKTVNVRVTDDDDENDSDSTAVEVKNYLLYLPLISKQP